MNNTYIYILVMAVVTYLIRALPLTLIHKEINNQFFKSFLYYIPYVTLAAMVFPDILTCSGNMTTSIVGFIVALILAYKEKSLITVAILACVAVYLTGLII